MDNFKFNINKNKKNFDINNNNKYKELFRFDSLSEEDKTIINNNNLLKTKKISKFIKIILYLNN